MPRSSPMPGDWGQPAVCFESSPSDSTEHQVRSQGVGLMGHHKKSTRCDGIHRTFRVFLAAGWSMEGKEVNGGSRVCLGSRGYAEETFFKVLVYVNILSRTKSMTRHHSGGQNSQDLVRRILHWLEE